MRFMRHKRFLVHATRDGLRFLFQNSQLLFLIGFALLSAFLGTMLYDTLSDDRQSALSFIVSSSQPPTDFLSGCRAVISSSFLNLLLLAIMFLFGITPYGCPLILGILFIFGFRTGILQSFAYLDNGYRNVIFTVLPSIIISGTAFLLASQTALHMSCVFSRQLMPFCAHCGGLWHDFKRYMIRFLVYSILVLTSAITETLLIIIYQMM